MGTLIGLLLSSWLFEVWTRFQLPLRHGDEAGRHNVVKCCGLPGNRRGDLLGSIFLIFRAGCGSPAVLWQQP